MGTASRSAASRSLPESLTLTYTGAAEHPHRSLGRRLRAFPASVPSTEHDGHSQYSTARGAAVPRSDRHFRWQLDPGKHLDGPAGGLTFTYTNASGFSIGGAASVSVASFGSIFVTAAGTFDTSGDLQTFTFTATSGSAQVDLAGVTIAPTGLTVSYDTSDGVTVGGSASVFLSQLGSFVVTFSGNINNNTLESLDLTVSEILDTNVLKIVGVTVTPQSFTFDYTPVSLMVSGTVEISGSLAGELSINPPRPRSRPPFRMVRCRAYR